MGTRTAIRRPALRRTTDDRVIAGVCGGLAERANIDAVAVRLVFVLGAMVWGASLPIYGLLWHRLPEIDTPTTNRVRPSRPPSTSLAMGAVACLAALLLGLRSIGVLPPDAVVLPLGLAALGVMFLWSSHPLRPIARPAITSGGSDASTDAVEADTDAPRPRDDRPVERAPHGSSLIGATLLVACLGFLVDRVGIIDVQWRVLGAVLLAILGVVLVFGSARGRPTGLLGAGGLLLLALLAATIFQVPLGSGVGARTLRPIDLAGADTHLAGGSLSIDARDLDFDGTEPLRLDASVAVGDLRITVPIGVEVMVEARTGLGTLVVFAEASSGIGQSQTFASDGFDETTGQLVVSATVGVGRLIVEQQEQES